MRSNTSVDQAKRNKLITKLNTQIQSIILELAHLRSDQDEEGLVRFSELTLQRDRLMGRLDELVMNSADHAKEHDWSKRSKQSKQSNHFKQTNKVNIGKQVVLENDEISMKVNIVDENLVDPSKGEISPNSPIGKEIVNKKVGETVEVKTPAGLMQYKILQVI